VAGAIVVGFDGHDVAGRALDRGISEAKASGARLVIVVVEEAPVDPNMAPPFSIGPPPVVAAVADEFEQPAGLTKIADEALQRATSAGVSAELVWEVGDPMRSIVDAARDHQASLIILGTHHYNILQRFLGEDVAAAVKRRVDCDVVTVD
jgi:nucleotide-binding universal stress UspA family protein